VLRPARAPQTEGLRPRRSSAQRLWSLRCHGSPLPVSADAGHMLGVRRAVIKSLVGRGPASWKLRSRRAHTTPAARCTDHSICVRLDFFGGVPERLPRSRVLEREIIPGGASERRIGTHMTSRHRRLVTAICAQSARRPGRQTAATMTRQKLPSPGWQLYRADRASSRMRCSNAIHNRRCQLSGRAEIR
jgi:hypothetical protein